MSRQAFAWRDLLPQGSASLCLCLLWCVFVALYFACPANSTFPPRHLTPFLLAESFSPQWRSEEAVHATPPGPIPTLWKRSGSSGGHLTVLDPFTALFHLSLHHLRINAQTSFSLLAIVAYPTGSFAINMLYVIPRLEIDL